MHNNLSEGSSRVITTAYQKSALKIGYLMLIVFAFLRPLSLAFGNVEFGGLNFLELFAIVISYLLIIPILINIRRLRIDLISFIILYFCFYCACSIAWGSEASTVAKIILPFITFFAVRCNVENSKHINFLIFYLAIGYTVLLVISAYYVQMGVLASVAKIEIHTEIQRHRGVFLKIHVFAHAALLFSFLYAYLIEQFKFNNRIVLWCLHFSFIVSIFCLYKTYTRTTYFGFILFWTIYLWGKSKKICICFLIVLLTIFALFQSHTEKIFWKTTEKGQHDLHRAGSGRFALWEHNLSIYSSWNIGRKIIGSGVQKSEKIIGSASELWSFHNDFIAILTRLGLIGLLLYLSILFVLLKDIYVSKLKRKSKFIFYGIVIAVMVMNSVSNAYVHRVELAQIFWLFMGSFYMLKDQRGR